MLARRHLLPIAILSLLALLITLIPLYPNDLWWHMRSGEQIARGGPIPTTDTYSFTGYGQPFVYSGWASQTLLYLLHAWGGAAALVIARNLLIVGAYALAMLGAWKRGSNWTVAALLTLWTGLFSVEFWHARPQIFGYLPFVALLFVLLRYADGGLRARWLLLAPLVTVVWTNVHGAFTLAPVLSGLVALGATIDTVMRREHRLESRKLALLWATVVGVALAMLVNPWGWGISAAVRLLLTDEAIKQFVVEWQPPQPDSLFRSLFFASILGAVATWALSRRRASLAELLLFAALVWQSWTASRFIVWYGLALPLLLAPSLAALVPASRRRPTPEIALINVVVALLLVALPLSQQPGSPLRRLLPEAYRSALAAERDEQPLLIGSTPTGAVDYLREHPLPPNARMFNETGAGSYLIWAWRDGLVFADPRYTPQSLEVWRDYRQIVTGCGYAPLLEKYGITHVLADHQFQPGLAAALADDPGWRAVWQNQYATLYERTGQPSVEPPCQTRHTAPIEASREAPAPTP